jgi:hypothetical protein
MANPVSRRLFLGTAMAAAVPPAARPQDPLWKLWARLVTGGAPYRPSFSAMFLDPMFIEIEVGPYDQPYNMSIVPSGRGAGRATVPGRGQPGNAAPILIDNPPDLPWIPSTQAQTGVRGLLPGGAPVFSVLILNDQMDWPNDAREAMQRNLDAGKGIVVMHHALGDNQSWPWWREEITGGLLALQDGEGIKKTVVTPNATLDVRPVGNHPIVRDIGPLRLVRETAYKGMWQSPKITPLLETTGASSDKVVAWIGPNPKARVVCIQPGAASETHRNPAFRKLVRNAVLWAGGRLD